MDSALSMVVKHGSPQWLFHSGDAVPPGRVQQEIDEVIGQVRCPEMTDQAHMPYTNAVIHEVQRFGDVAPLNLPRITSCDIEVQDFVIPKVGMDLSQFHQDPLSNKDRSSRPLHPIPNVLTRPECMQAAAMESSNKENCQIKMFKGNMQCSTQR